MDERVLHSLRAQRGFRTFFRYFLNHDLSDGDLVVLFFKNGNISFKFYIRIKYTVDFTLDIRWLQLGVNWSEALKEAVNNRKKGISRELREKKDLAQSLSRTRNSVSWLFDISDGTHYQSC